MKNCISKIINNIICSTCKEKNYCNIRYMKASEITQTNNNIKLVYFCPKRQKKRNK